MSQEKITVRCECPACRGTGLYKHWTCHDGTAFVCRKCKGTGAVELSYTPFGGRKKATGVERVFSSDSLVEVFPSTHTFDDGTIIDYSKYGCTLEEWETGIQPIPLPYK